MGNSTTKPVNWRADRGAIRVDIDRSSGRCRSLTVSSHLLADEIAPTLRAALQAASRQLVESHRARRENLVQQQVKSGPMMARWRGTLGARAKEATAALADQTFLGNAADGLVRVTVDGESAFVSLHLDASLSDRAACALAHDAWDAAITKCEAAWQASLTRALSESDEAPAALNAGQTATGGPTPSEIPHSNGADAPSPKAQMNLPANLTTTASVNEPTHFGQISLELGRRAKKWEE